MGKSRKDNPEKLANKAHKTKKKPHKHNTICVGHHYGQTNINNVNKTKQHQLELKIQIHKTYNTYLERVLPEIHYTYYLCHLGYVAILLYVWDMYNVLI